MFRGSTQDQVGTCGKKGWVLPDSMKFLQAGSHRGVTQGCPSFGLYREQAWSRDFMRLAWGVQTWLGRECPGLYWVVPGSSALCPPAGGPATVTFSTHISLESSTEASGYWGEPRFCLTVKHYLYQIIKLVRYATRLEGSEGRDSCTHLPWRGSHGNYTMNMLLILLTLNLHHIHTVLCHSTTGRGSEKGGLRMFRSGNIMECISQIWTV